MEEESVLGGRMRLLRSILSLRCWTLEDIKSQGGKLRVVRLMWALFVQREK